MHRTILTTVVITVVLFASLLMLVTNVAISEVKNPTMPASTTQAESGKSIKLDTDTEKPRGQLLYENHCSGCHDKSVHGRNPRKADSIEKIKHWVSNWNKELKLNWSDSDINDVTQFLNSRYYQFTE